MKFYYGAFHLKNSFLFSAFHRFVSHRELKVNKYVHHLFIKRKISHLFSSFLSTFDNHQFKEQLNVYLSKPNGKHVLLSHEPNTTARRLNGNKMTHRVKKRSSCISIITDSDLAYKVKPFVCRRHLRRVLTRLRGHHHNSCVSHYGSLGSSRMSN